MLQECYYGRGRLNSCADGALQNIAVAGTLEGAAGGHLRTVLDEVVCEEGDPTEWSSARGGYAAGAAGKPSPQLSGQQVHSGVSWGNEDGGVSMPDTSAGGQRPSPKRYCGPPT